MNAIAVAAEVAADRPGDSIPLIPTEEEPTTASSLAERSIGNPGLYHRAAVLWTEPPS